MTDSSTPDFNPYPGLRPFNGEDSHLFFGREIQRTALLSRLRTTRFLAVVGSSGSGKSSLVKAGLLPALHGGFMAGHGSQWRIVDTRPGGDPIARLAAALDAPGALTETGIPEDELSFTEASLRRSSWGLIDVINEAQLNEGERVLILVDQFEELFRNIDEGRNAVKATNEATAFVNLLLEAAEQKETPIYIVLTMRTDYIGDCARFRGLPEAINDGQYLVPRLTREQLREVIIGPAKLGGANISSVLLNHLLNDIDASADYLPILQHALMRTWEYWRKAGDKKSLDMTHYKKIGGMTEALSIHAKSKYDSLDNDEPKRIAASMFKSLTDKDDGGQLVRRLASIEEIAQVANTSCEKVIGVIDVFREKNTSFIMPPKDVQLTPETIVDISHESLIRNWEILKNWTNEEAASAKTYKRIYETAALYPEKEDLLDGRRLHAAMEWFQQQKPNTNWAMRYNKSAASFKKAMSFLYESQTAHETRVENTNSAKRVKRKLFCFGGLITVTIILAGILKLANNYQEIQQDIKLRHNADKMLQQSYATLSKRLNQSVTPAKKNVRKILTAKYVAETNDSDFRKKLAKDFLQIKKAGSAYYTVALSQRKRLIEEKDISLYKNEKLLFTIYQDADSNQAFKRLTEDDTTKTGKKNFDDAIIEIASSYMNRKKQPAQTFFNYVLNDELQETLVDHWEEWGYYLQALVVFLLLPIFRWIQIYRKKRAFFPAFARCYAALVDLGFAVLLGYIITASLMMLVSIFEAFHHFDEDFYLTISVTFGVIVGLSYLTFRDALYLRYKRSLGKICFGLCPIYNNNKATNLKIAFKRNMRSLQFFIGAGVILILLAMIDDDLLLIGLGLLGLALPILMITWLVLISRGNKQSLGDRYANTRVLDICTDEFENIIKNKPAYIQTNNSDQTHNALLAVIDDISVEGSASPT